MHKLFVRNNKTNQTKEVTNRKELEDKQQHMQTIAEETNVHVVQENQHYMMCSLIFGTDLGYYRYKFKTEGGEKR